MKSQLVHSSSSACKGSCRPHLAYNFAALHPLRPCCVANSSRARQCQLNSSRPAGLHCSGTTSSRQAAPCHSSAVCSASSSSHQATTAAAPAPAAVPTATASSVTSTTAAQRILPFAALSRVLLNANNSSMFRTALNKRQPVSGPMGLLLFLMTLIAASIAAIRGVLVKKGKSCKTCRGFGLQRCRLCLGSGRVDWAAKLKHFDVCPLCMNKRFIICAECGGHYHRPMFCHRRRQAGGALEPVGPQTNTPQGGFEGPIVLNLAMAGAGTGAAAALSSVDGPIPSSMND